MRTRLYDTVVVGAGPAGSATAAFLAEQGFDVALVDRASFPRPKPCAEYLSPEASRVLDRLGIRAALEHRCHARLVGMRIVSPAGTSFVGRFAGEHPYHGYSDYGLALRREVLDTHLLEAAARSGAQVYERTVVEAMGDVDRVGRTLLARRRTERMAFRARLIVGADGLNSRIARLLRLTRRGRRRRMALVSHATGVAGMADVGEMHVGHRGYVGLAPVGDGLTNVAAVTDLARGAPGDTPETWFHHLLGEFPAVEARLGGATFVTPVRAVGPFARWARRATANRAVLVGDAADFYDPFTGEGIYAALHGAELAAERIAQGLAADRLRQSDLAPYDAARRGAFGGKWLVERLVSWSVAHPAVFNHCARRLAAHPGMADLLVGVAGDFVPPSRILRASFAWQLVR